MTDYSYEDETSSYMKLSMYSDTITDPSSAIATAEYECNLHQEVFEADYRPYSRSHTRIWHR